MREQISEIGRRMSVLGGRLARAAGAAVVRLLRSPPVRAAGAFAARLERAAGAALSRALRSPPVQAAVAVLRAQSGRLIRATGPALVRLRDSRFVRASAAAAGAAFGRLRESHLGRATGRAFLRLMDTRAGRAAQAWVLLARTRCVVLAQDLVIFWLGKGMTSGERALLDRVRGGRDPDCLMRTGTRVDVGEWCNQWWGGGRVWVAVLGRELAMLAHGRRPHVERVPTAEMGASQYNPVTGELILARSADDTVRRLRVPPLEGWRLLGYMTGKGD
ncbi:MAG: hypothetical protein FJ225_00340 [Lentisphaerae bacterium]|nr:hypothetical protein [Lentisphaerota bacterium]